MGIDVASFEETEALITTIQEIPKKWNIPPAFRYRYFHSNVYFFKSEFNILCFDLFSVEFIGYFLDRDARVNRLKKQLSYHAENKIRLTNEQQDLQKKYDSVSSLENLHRYATSTLKS